MFPNWTWTFDPYKHHYKDANYFFELFSKSLEDQEQFYATANLTE